MNVQKKIFVWQTDQRMQAAARYLAGQDWLVTGQALAGECGIWLLPMPLSAERPGLVQLLLQAAPGTLVLAGRIDPAVYALPGADKLTLLDLYQNPALVEKNAIPTAEGCIQLLLCHSARTLWQEPVLLLGFGRVGQALGVRLAALGAFVTVAARSPVQRAKAESLGCRADSPDRLDHPMPWRVVVNTIPSRVLEQARLRNLPQGSLLIDLASKPGGIDFQAARKMGHTALHALALPGKCAPETAGRFYAETALEGMEERSTVCI